MTSQTDFFAGKEMKTPRTKHEAEQMGDAIAAEQAEMVMPPRGPDRDAWRERLREMDAHRAELARLHETLPERGRPKAKPAKRGRSTVRGLQRDLTRWFG